MHRGKNLTVDTGSWTNEQWPRTLPVGQRETGAKSWDGTDLTWLGLLQRKMTSRWPALGSRTPAEQDGTHRILPLSSSVPLSKGQEILGRNKVQVQNSWCCQLIWKQGSSLELRLPEKPCNGSLAGKDLSILTFLLSPAV